MDSIHPKAGKAACPRCLGGQVKMSREHWRREGWFLWLAIRTAGSPGDRGEPWEVDLWRAGKS